MDIRRASFFQAPDFWKSGWEEVNAFIDGLDKAEVWEIGRSQGGHSIRALAYGDKEPIQRRTTYSSAIASGHPEDFYDPEKRQKPVLLIMGAVHAAEIEGTVTCCNMAQLMETGTDLRGRRWDQLRAVADQLRVVMVPLPQPDGRVRVPVRNLIGGTVDDLYYYGQGVMQDGEILRWPECKRMQPVPLDEMQLVGGYYNDAGINIQHDDFLSAHVAPETRALLDLVHDETPDCFLTLHSCGPGPFLIAPENHLSQACQFHQAQLGALIAERHRRDGLRPGGGPRVAPRGGFYLHTALHFNSGALPLLFEYPHGLEMKPFTFDEILDVGLGLFEEVMRYGTVCRYAPR
jgi:zinc carboxypeptidase